MELEGTLKRQFGDKQTEVEYNCQRVYFLNMHKDRGKHHTMKTVKKASSLESFAVEREGWDRSKYLNKWYYLLASILLCLPCYRIWMTTIVGDNTYKHYKYTLMKELNIFVPKDLLINGIFGKSFVNNDCILANDICNLI